MTNNITNKKTTEMEDMKVKLSTLWIFVMFKEVMEKSVPGIPTMRRILPDTSKKYCAGFITALISAIFQSHPT